METIINSLPFKVLMYLSWSQGEVGMQIISDQIVFFTAYSVMVQCQLCVCGGKQRETEKENVLRGVV